MQFSKLALCASAAAVLFSLTACSTVDLDKDKDGSNVADGTSVEEMLNSKIKMKMHRIQCKFSVTLSNK